SRVLDGDSMVVRRWLQDRQNEDQTGHCTSTEHPSAPSGAGFGGDFRGHRHR
ncbi:hypothetical protein U1Q18_025805, partial [Sarracenia purpurea var. burkii]